VKLIIHFCSSLRSLVANLGAANYFTVEHLDDPKNKQFIEKAKIFYTAVNIRQIVK
jgi:hypothetical protein